MTTTPQPSQAFQSTATKPATNRELPLPQSDRDPKSYRGVDRDQQVVDIISKLTSEKATIPASCVQRDAADTGLESNSADVVIGEAMLTMQTERGKQAIIGEAFRLLRAGGTYSIHELGLQPDNLDESVKDEVRKHEHAEGAAAEPGTKKECHCKHGEVAAAEAGEAKHCACKHDAHDAEGHAISTEPHFGFIEDLASLIDIQEEATVSRTVLREDGLRAVLFGFDKDQALSEHTAAMPVTIQVLEGKLRVGGEGREIELTAGGIVYLSARLPHTVYAVEPSKMLLQMFDNRG